jgi:hypothetical protein
MIKVLETTTFFCNFFTKNFTVKRIPFNLSLVTPFLLVFLVSVFAIFSGGLIYILLRPAEPVFFDWFKCIGLDNFLFNIRQYSLSLKRFLPEWFIYSLPNGLWALSYSLIITAIWWNSKSRLKIFWMASIPVLVFGFEVFQYLEILNGTFCIGDIAFGVSGILAGVALGIKIKTNKINNYETNME